MLKLEKVSKTYKHRGHPVTGLDNVTFHIPKGDFISVVGPSGSGKSTFLLTLGGMLSPSRGQVFLDGQSFYDLTQNQRAEMRRDKIGFVFQTFNLVPYLSAVENVQIPLFLAGKNGSSQKDAATLLLERLGLLDRQHHKPSELSVGQQQRVALARMLVNEPEVILADEPTGNLDPETTQQIITFLHELNKEGRTIVMVTHDPGVAQSAKRTLSLVEGRVLSEE